MDMKDFIVKFDACDEINMVLQLSPVGVEDLGKCSVNTLNKNQVALRQEFDSLYKALNFIHKIGYVHRDIRPSNIIVTKRSPFKLVLIDFGLALRGEKQRNDKYNW